MPLCSVFLAGLEMLIFVKPPVGCRVVMFLLSTVANDSPPMQPCTVCLGASCGDGLRQLVNPGLHEPQLQVEWSVTLLYSLVVKRRCWLGARNGVA